MEDFFAEPDEDDQNEEEILTIEEALKQRTGPKRASSSPIEKETEYDINIFK